MVTFDEASCPHMQEVIVYISKQQSSGLLNVVRVCEKINSDIDDIETAFPV